MFFQVVKQAFSDIYQAFTPLETELKFDNCIRSLASQHLVFLGDLCKFKIKIQKKDKSKPKEVLSKQ